MCWYYLLYGSNFKWVFGGVDNKAGFVLAEKATSSKHNPYYDSTNKKLAYLNSGEYIYVKDADSTTYSSTSGKITATKYSLLSRLGSNKFVAASYRNLYVYEKINNVWTLVKTFSVDSNYSIRDVTPINNSVLVYCTLGYNKTGAPSKFYVIDY